MAPVLNLLTDLWKGTVMLSGCEECNRMWREYKAAANEHVRLANKLQLAALNCDSEAIAILMLEVEAAIEKGHASRETIRTHETEHAAATTAAQA
jgi:hypothetical protein